MENTYEDECMRAELLGIEKPNREEFEKERLLRLQNVQEEMQIAESALLEEQDESLRGTGGKLHELNSILSSTQQKLNRFKQSASSRFCTIFNRSQDIESHDANQKPVDGEANNVETAIAMDVSMPECSQTDIQPVIPTEIIRNAKIDVQQKMSSHLTQLDSLLVAAERAEISMSEQTKQMRKMAK